MIQGVHAPRITKDAFDVDFKINSNTPLNFLEISQFLKFRDVLQMLANFPTLYHFPWKALIALL
jgi:hypothetical protein